MRKTGLTMNKLCCIVNPMVICKGCSEQWCEDCADAADWDHPHKREGIWICPTVGEVKITSFTVFPTILEKS